ncbi:transcriptional regulator, TetR family [Prauserella aidingensis]|uniref:TetR/AcrR family transcriptional regulator n=1 Tax=Prauserella aidingensis TaxID=387890 RepID=UPI0020A2EAE8|nr:TetR/AcrR family transcriptional regulator C-terminal domain-containing protein [Prauserella aidingensis]MCP2254874.1 transcriptional regulator, TetR family [Prauserella aidingensis]MCP2255623.1 transcriptional regulator, TetR family [Prauserella aidingensis]
MPRNGNSTPLNRKRALRAAVELADAEGIDAVSMRGLASRLGVVPMALYKHVSNKDDLLDGMVDTLVADIDRPDPAQGWKTAVRDTILSARRTIVRHPWARHVIETRTRRTPDVLGYMDALAGAFLAGGFSAQLTHHVMHALGHRIWGFSPEAFDEPEVADDATPPADPAELEAMVEHMSATYPSITAITLATIDGDLSRLGEGCDEQFEFEFALDLLLDGFERLHEAGWSLANR